MEKRKRQSTKDDDINVHHELEEIKDEHEYLNWPNSAVKYTGLLRIRTPQGLDCLYHAILNALSVAYRSHELHGIDMSERLFVRGLRKELAIALQSKYDTLLEGKIHEMVTLDPSLGLPELTQQLMTSMNIPKPLLAFVCTELDLDLYYISAHNRDVFPIMTDMEQIIKGRRSVVVLYCRNHYELLGIHETKKIRATGEVYEEFITVFRHNHPFILQLKHQLGL